MDCELTWSQLSIWLRAIELPGHISWPDSSKSPWSSAAEWDTWGSVYLASRALMGPLGCPSGPLCHDLKTQSPQDSEPNRNLALYWFSSSSPDFLIVTRFREFASKFGLSEAQKPRCHFCLDIWGQSPVSSHLPGWTVTVTTAEDCCLEESVTISWNV